MRRLTIAGRGSLLARAQNRIIRGILEARGYTVDELTVTTRGDRDRTSPVTALGGDGPFVRELERVLLDKRADIAVHCVKDLPYETPEGLCIAGILDASDPRDCLIMARSMESERPVIGTGSPRRIQAIRQLYPSAVCRDIRGNITTRLDRLRRGEYDAIVLAKAGLDRIGADLGDLSVRVLEPGEMVPAVGQGMLACECRQDDTELTSLLMELTSPGDYLRYRIERDIFCELRCGCQSPIGIYAELSGLSVRLYLMTDEGTI